LHTDENPLPSLALTGITSAMRVSSRLLHASTLEVKAEKYGSID
jgi:hypothetical protein